MLTGFELYPRRVPLSIPDDSLYNSLLQAKAECFCQQFFSFSKRALCSGYSWSKIFLTGSVLYNKAPKIVKGRFLKKDREFMTRPFTEFITLVLLTLILIPYPSTVSCILSIISCRPLTELAKGLVIRTAYFLNEMAFLENRLLSSLDFTGRQSTVLCKSLY